MREGIWSGSFGTLKPPRVTGVAENSPTEWAGIGGDGSWNWKRQYECGRWRRISCRQRQQINGECRQPPLACSNVATCSLDAIVAGGKENLHTTAEAPAVWAVTVDVFR